MVSAYILFLNPLILSGASGGTNTGMPKEDVVLATAISTGVATLAMGLVANYPWVVSVQLGTNVFFVYSILQPYQQCGAHSHFQDGTAVCAGEPCTCNADGSVIQSGWWPAMDFIPFGVLRPDGSFDTSAGTPCAGTSALCTGTIIPFEEALAATFLEGLVFLAICFTGMRSRILRLFPKTVLMAGACGIGVFIAFVGMRNIPVLVPAPFPNLTKLASALNIGSDGYGNATLHTGIEWNSCVYQSELPPYDIFCPWLGIGGLVFTGILLLWNINGAFIFGIFFTMFLSWIIFPHYQGGDPPGPIPTKGVAAPKFTTTAGALSFDWGPHTGKLVEAFITFLYLDFIGSSITFVSMGQMCGILDDQGSIPHSNKAFISDGLGTTIGGLLGTSALTTFVESASAVREGGRTGLTAVICAVLFFLSVFFWPIFSSIPNIATGPVLILIGVLIFMSSVQEIPWQDITEAGPAFITIIVMATTNNIAYGCIAGIIAYVIVKFVTYGLFPKYQEKWWGYNQYKKWSAVRCMHINMDGEGGAHSKFPGMQRANAWLNRTQSGFSQRMRRKNSNAPTADSLPTAESLAVSLPSQSAHSTTPFKVDDSAHDPDVSLADLKLGDEAPKM
ncbi:hypothetical protein WJX73_008142 [Symbiochloris irregularis]|uniref:Xanthine/uracil permease n=1 Tax=Symbiochloris irregularis TaxID=706552 RepID=A0AAW1PAP6_9CHLO